MIREFTRLWRGSYVEPLPSLGKKRRYRMSKMIISNASTGFEWTKFTVQTKSAGATVLFFWCIRWDGENLFCVCQSEKKKKKNPFRGYSMWVPLCVCGCWPAGPFAHASVSALMKRKTRAQMDVGGEDFATDECICNGEAVTMMKWVKTRSWRYGCNLDKLVTEEVKIISEFELTSLIWPF